MRLFAALELSDEARVAVATEQARLRRRLGDRAPRWVKPELMHVTLVFIGHAEPPRVPAIVEAMSRSLPLPPFTLSFGGTGVFPERGAPRVLWLAARDGAAQAVALQRLVAARLQPLGVPPDGRGFHPHLTLARWRDGGQPLARDRAVHPEGPTVATIRVEAVALFESRLSNAGPAYTAVTHAPLQ